MIALVAFVVSILAQLVFFYTQLLFFPKWLPYKWKTIANGINAASY
jgi:hypothetical protein